jgi:hypothetical protein
LKKQSIEVNDRKHTTESETDQAAAERSGPGRTLVLADSRAALNEGLPVTFLPSGGEASPGLPSRIIDPVPPPYSARFRA